MYFLSLSLIHLLSHGFSGYQTFISFLLLTRTPLVKFIKDDASENASSSLSIDKKVKKIFSFDMKKPENWYSFNDVWLFNMFWLAAETRGFT